VAASSHFLKYLPHDAWVSVKNPFVFSLSKSKESMHANTIKAWGGVWQETPLYTAKFEAPVSNKRTQNTILKLLYKKHYNNGQ